MCLSPIVLKRTPTPACPTGLQTVPCGKCLECVKRRRENWAQRLYEESKDHYYSSFVTLTYDDEHLIDLWSDEAQDFSLRKSDLQDFIKRLRITLDRKYRRYSTQCVKPVVRYFAAGEYGTKGQRPHYHLIVFGLSEYNCDLYKLLSDTWDKGIFYVGDVTLASIRYTCGYLLKQQFITVHPGLEPPFHLASRKPPLGHKFIERELKRLHGKSNEYKLKHAYYTYYGGQKAAYCRYYTDKIFKDETQFFFKPVRRNAIIREADRSEQIFIGAHRGSEAESLLNRQNSRRDEFDNFRRRCK